MQTGLGRPAGADLAGLNQGNRVRFLTTNLFTLDVDTPREAILVSPIPEATANWTGWLDGMPAPLLGVDGAFLGLRVPAGRHTLGLRYFSTRIVLGYRIAFATALALAAARARAPRVGGLAPTRRSRRVRRGSRGGARRDGAACLQPVGE